MIGDFVGTIRTYSRLFLNSLVTIWGLFDKFWVLFGDRSGLFMNVWGLFGIIARLFGAPTEEESQVY